jgi:hypothetical protein
MLGQLFKHLGKYATGLVEYCDDKERNVFGACVCCIYLFNCVMQQEELWSVSSVNEEVKEESADEWTMAARAGASICYSDTICDLGGASELANYEEYSGAPSEQKTYKYAETYLSLCVRRNIHRAR